MPVFRPVPLGAACLLYATLLGAVPVTDVPSPLATPVAQASPALRGAVRAALQNSPELAAARADLDAARARARAAAQPLYNPSLVLDAEHADVDRHTVGVALALDVSGKRRARADVGTADEEVAELGHALLQRDVATRWLRAWAGATSATRQRELGQRRLALMQRFDQLAAERLRVGDISSPERDLAGLALGEAQWQQATLAGDEAAARASLRAISGDLAGQAPALPEGLAPMLESVPPRALDELPELRRARARQDRAEAGVQVARRARMPDPELSLTGGEVRSGSRTDRVLGISVSIPLPIRNSGRAEVEAARAEAAAADAGVRSIEWVSSARLQETRERYAALREATVAFRRGRAAAFEDRTTLLEKLWRAGEITTSDYLLQLRQSLDTALSGQELESRTWQAWFDYLSAAGRLDDWLGEPTQDAAR
ncbi:cobalt-zinc-cadmium efflux system outer membrane protein [Rhodanobacter sp. TND4EL1]